MTPRSSVHPQLGLMAEFVQQANHVTDLPRLVDHVVSHVRDGIAPRDRDPAALKGLRERLTRNFEAILAESLPNDLPRAELGDLKLHGDQGNPMEALLETLDAAATLLDAHPDARWDGAVLRASGNALADASRLLANRHCALRTLDVLRGLEELGSPPALVYLPNGSLVWINGALRQFCEARRVDREPLIEAASAFAGPFCRFALMGDKPPARKSIRLEQPAVHLKGEVVTPRGKRESSVVITVSEARRAGALSKRELEAARQLCTVGSYQAVADLLGISLDSVRTHLRRAYRKLGVSNRVAMKDRLIREGLLPRR